MSVQGLTLGGWFFMLSAWSLLTGLVLFCMRKVLSAKNIPKLPEDDYEKD